MGLFDILSDNVLNTGKSAVSKAKEVADTAKLKTEIVAEESKLKSVYAEIGKLYYEKSEGDIAPEFQELFEKAAAVKAVVDEKKAEIQKIKKTVTCLACGTEVAEGSAFCSACGAPIPAKKEECCCEEEEICECGCAEEAEPCECGCAEEAEAEEKCCCGEAAEAETECCCGEAETECCCGEAETEGCCAEEAEEKCCCGE